MVKIAAFSRVASMATPRKALEKCDLNICSKLIGNDSGHGVTTAFFLDLRQKRHPATVRRTARGYFGVVFVRGLDPWRSADPAAGALWTSESCRFPSGREGEAGVFVKWRHPTPFQPTPARFHPLQLRRE